jgi:hypothetical protein
VEGFDRVRGKGMVRGWLVRVREREKAKIRGEGKE